MNEQFYDSMADYYHLIFEDWDASMRRQGAAIAKLLPPPEEVGLILRCGLRYRHPIVGTGSYRIRRGGLGYICC